MSNLGYSFYSGASGRDYKKKNYNLVVYRRNDLRKW